MSDSDDDDTRLKLIFTFVLLAVGLLVWFASSLKDTEDWNRYRDANHCYVEGRIEGRWAYSRRSVWVPATVLWRCDDGQLHGRDE